VNTGVNTGVLAGDDVTDTVVGDGNQVVNVDGEVDESVLHFGEGDVTNVGDASFDDAAVVVGGGAAGVVSDVSVGEGAAVSVGGDATGGFEEAYQDVDVEAYDSVVSTGQGPGDQQ